MKIVKEKIVEATEDELAILFLQGDMYNLYTWTDFLAKMKSDGCKIIYSMRETDIEELVNEHV